MAGTARDVDPGVEGKGSCRLLLLRHGEVESHRGDVPITASAVETARRVGGELAGLASDAVTVLTGETRRATQTAAAIAGGLAAKGVAVIGPRVSFALRNPDLYVAGTRVNMVSSAETLAEQVDGLTAGDVAGLEFFPEFFASPDRIGWWLRHTTPPGEDARSLATRVRRFAESLTDPTVTPLVVAVTHSPLLRALALDVMGTDIGEPAWISGLDVHISPGGRLTVDRFGGG